jgi:hypothetical protein
MEAEAAFSEVVSAIERGKEALVSAVPTARGQGTPLAVALHTFETAIRQARAGMDAWRTAETEEIWQASSSALREAAERAERLRLEAPSLDYEGLVMTLGDLMAPLDVFADAARRFR